MKKLHADGLLESLDYESFDACEPCLMSKMTKTPFSGTMKRANDLLEIIHIDVCSPMSVQACDEYLYFLTFTVDLILLKNRNFALTRNNSINHRNMLLH